MRLVLGCISLLFITELWYAGFLRKHLKCVSVTELVIPYLELHYQWFSAC